MNLKELRLKCQITQQDLAKAISVNRSTYAMWESGKSQPPLNKISALASALNVSAGEIVSCILAIRQTSFRNIGKSGVLYGNVNF